MPDSEKASTMQLTHSILLTGASGVGKSTLMRRMLECYKSGAVVLAPGSDERDSYLGLDGPAYVFGAFDDIMFQPSLSQWDASGHRDMVRWLQKVYLECADDVKNGKPPRYAVLAIDTLSAVGRLAYNATMAKYQRTEPPAAQSPDGAAFYTNLRITLESGVRLMRAIRGLGVHWIAAAHPAESQVTEILKTQADPSASKIIPDLPGGFKNQLPAYFNVVFNCGIMNAQGGKRAHYLQWRGDPKRVTKSRFGPLSENEYLPADWAVVDAAIRAAAERAFVGEKK